MSRFGWHVDRYESEGKFRIVDAVSAARLGLSGNIDRGAIGLNPTPMLIFLSEQLRRSEPTSESGKPFLVIDSISRLLLFCDTRSVIDFVSCLSSRLENFEISGIASVTQGAHDDRNLNALIFSCVGALSFRITETDGNRTRQVRIETLRERRHNDRWKNYRITNTGLDIEI